MRASFAALMVLLLGVAGDRVYAEDPKTAVFAGGCFWCVESDFDKVPGVLKTISGYTGGSLENPTYEQVTMGGTGHREVVEITYDPSVVSYSDLLMIFWRSIDPTDGRGQFCDRGHSYSTAIYTTTDEERALAEASKKSAEAYLDTEVATAIEPASEFYPAEAYHQDYYKKSPLRYRYYRWNCGRNQRVEAVWGDQAYKGIPKKD